MNNINDALPSGIRNNNPGNLRGLPNFQGATRGHSGLLVFDTEVNGVRAAALNLHTQYFNHGLKTVGAIITKYAPPAENPTEAYIAFVCECMGIKEARAFIEDVHLDHAWQVLRFMDAQFIFENGKPPETWHSWPSWYCTRTYLEAMMKADLWKDL